MKVEMVLPSLQVGGMEHMAVTLSTALHRAGMEVGVTCVDNADGELIKTLTSVGIRVSFQKAPGFLSNFSAPGLATHFTRLRPDVVHSHSGVWGRACRAARMAGIRRTVHTVHGKPDQDPWFDIPLRKWEARMTDRIVTVSAPLAEDLVVRVGVDRSKISICENGVDSSKFTPDALDRSLIRRALDVSDRLVFGVVARLVSVKNLHVLIEAFAEIRSKIPLEHRPVLLLVGAGPLELELRSIAEHWGLAESCRFLGERADTDRVHRAIDIFVLPSLAEGTSISILESMASGALVVATPVGSNPKLLGRNERGILASGPDRSSIAAAMLTAASSYQDAKLQKAARDFVVEHYSVERMTADYLRFYS